ncbi:MAG TPA: NADP-dependent oxidoreductase [Tepidisphaeraceae bacterium]|jgi:NADPH:quinone reductase-like Zn-dependent oxidoreductase|nr:NADP-dependent oxidoreductase [Tepidisphaeraceae bacterium]
MTSQTQHTMNAAAIDAFGGAVVPHMLPVPQPGPGEVLIRVESAGVGAWDPFEQQGGFAKMMGGKPTFPYVLGSEGAGTVVDAGPQVRAFKKGDRVYALALANPKGGFYAEYAAVKAENASLIPGGLTIEQAGVMPVDAMTALTGLDDILGLRSGETVLVFGASGGIGHLAVQLAKRMGARVFAVASGNDGVALAKRLGADVAVDGHQQDVVAAARQFAAGGIDCALLTAGGKQADHAIECLRDGGRVAYPNGVEPAPKARPGIKIRNYDGGTGSQNIARLNQLIGDKPFEVHVARTFPLNQVAEALKALNEHYLGKLALKPA